MTTSDTGDDNTETQLQDEKQSDPVDVSMQSITGMNSNLSPIYVIKYRNMGMAAVVKSLTTEEKNAFRDAYRPFLEFKKKTLVLTKEWRIYRSRMIAYGKMLKKGIAAIKPVTPKPTPPVSQVEDPNFNNMDPAPTPAVHHGFEPTTWSAGENVVIRRFVGNKEVPFNSAEDVYPSPNATLSFSLVAVGR